MGLSSGLAPGPLFMLTISETLRFGVKAGLKVAAAPLITDAPIVAAALFILSRITGVDKILGAIFICGGLFLCVLAWESLSFSGAGIKESGQAEKSLSKAIIANFLNPAPYLFWLTIAGPLVAAAYEKSLVQAASFILAFYLSFFGAKAAIAFIVNSSRSFLAGGKYILVIRILGAALSVYAVIFFYNGLHKLGVL